MSPLSRRALLGTVPLIGVGGLAGVAATPGAVPAAEAASSRPIYFSCWDNTYRFGKGTRSAVTIDSRGGLVLSRGTTRVRFDDPYGPARSYDRGSWTSPRVTTPFALTELIASWNASTPTGTWVEVALQGRTTSGRTTRWYLLGRWVSGDASSDIHRASVDGQTDTYATVNTDTFATHNGYKIVSYVLRVNLYRPAGSSATPRVGLISGMASALPKASTVTVSAKGGAQGKVLAVPTYSQEKHRGHYPKWDGGGEAWCSATSTAMVLDYWRLGPPASATSWVTVKGETRPQVDHVARCVYDYTYEGTGNWPFNTAYAGARGARSFVTRLRSLREAEEFIKAGIPLICSVSFRSSELTGAGYSTNGHLLVIVGFAANGDVVINDPASHLMASDAQVRVTYRRSQFENVWIPRSGGLVYVIAPWSRALPRTLVRGEPNWGSPG